MKRHKFARFRRARGFPMKTKMAPNCPEEVDVFTIPHSRMKELVNRYLSLMTDTNFSDVQHLTMLLENLVNAFQEFRTHEQIENKYIMRKLKQKLQTLSIRSTAVCNCHSDNKLSEMLLLLQDGYRCREKTEVDRINFGLKLRTALEEFTGTFIPHMEEEEKVFQPMLIKYFTFEELKALKNKVISKHLQKSEDFAENQDFICDSSDDEEKSLKTEKAAEIQGIDKLPNEVMLQIFSFLDPQELCQCAGVSYRWNSLAMDGSNWKILRPVQWSRGQWSNKNMMDIDSEEEKLSTRDDVIEEVKFDEDADIDESEVSDSDSDSYNAEIRLIQREAKMLTSMVRYLLPRVGKSVTECHLAYSRGVTNGVLYKVLGLCPNLEVLDLTQTRVSDIGFKSLGSNKSGRNLRHVELAGCVNITDKTLQLLSFALGPSFCHSDVAEDRQEQLEMKEHIKVEKNEIEQSEKCLLANRKQGLGRDSKETSVIPKGGSREVPLYEEDRKISPVIGKKTYESDVMKHHIESGDYLDYEAVDKTLREACDIVERKFILSRISDFIDGGDMLYPANKRGQVTKYSQNLSSCHPCSEQRRSTPVGRENSRSAWQNCPYILSETEAIMNYNRRSDIDQVRTNFCDDDGGGGQSSWSPSECDSIYPDWTILSGEDTDKDYDIDIVSSVERELEYLGLSGCHHITDEGIRSLVEDGGLPYLRHLDLSGCMKVTASGLSSLVSSCPNLDHEFLYYCDNMLDDPYLDTASGCQNLECTSRSCCRSGH